ncbi:natriuretic peptides A-like [Spea bombifrons]|uniref:natriuretic peptides A-like n=1 Tax=Spea bombifrons TaxID=233779 RepID=UPI00234A2041|nr:natriuretic peptides A-like [Spea bombifrons]
MQRKFYLLWGSLLLFIFQLHVSGAHPIMDLDTDRDLDSFKNILEKLDEKLSLIEALESSPDLLEQSPKDVGVHLASPEDSEAPRPEARVTPNIRYSIKDSFLKGLRSLQNPKMMRDSGCFGRRIDRIDSLSGMGCNGFRRN